MRTECTHCGAAIEFEEDDRGLERACASCGETTMLVEGLHRLDPAALSDQPRRLARWGVRLVLIGVGLLAVVVGITWPSVGRPALSFLSTAYGVAQAAAMLVAFFVAAAFVIVVCVLWVIFPLFVYQGIQRMTLLLDQIERHLRRL